MRVIYKAALRFLTRVQISGIRMHLKYARMMHLSYDAQGTANTLN